MPKSQKCIILIAVLIIKLSKCNITNNKMEPFIVGGSYAKIQNFPHSAFLTVKCEDLEWICGASVLNQKVLLTAGHCVHGCTADGKILSYTGDDNLEQITTVIKIIRFIIHGQYNQSTMDNDIALTVLNRNLPLGRYIKRVIIPNPYPRHSRMAKVAGWGMVNDKTKEGTIKLKTVQQRVRRRSVCKVVGEMHAGMFCAGSTSQIHDRPSEGDSGSALIFEPSVQIGVVSFRVDTHPALMVYTNVTYYLPWITVMSNTVYCNCPLNTRVRRFCVNLNL